MAAQYQAPPQYNDWTTYPDAETAMLALNQQMQAISGPASGRGHGIVGITSNYSKTGLNNPQLAALQAQYDAKFPGIIYSKRHDAVNTSGLNRDLAKVSPYIALALLAGGGSALAAGAGEAAGAGAVAADAGIYSTEGVIGAGAGSTAGAAGGALGAGLADTSAGISSTEGVLGGGASLGGATAPAIDTAGFLGSEAGAGGASLGSLTEPGLVNLGEGAIAPAAGAGGSSLGSAVSGAPVVDLSTPVGAAPVLDLSNPIGAGAQQVGSTYASGSSLAQTLGQKALTNVATSALTGGGGSGTSSGTSSGGTNLGQVISGGAGLIGGVLSANAAPGIANQIAGIADPFLQYRQKFGDILSGAASNGTYGNAPQPLAGTGDKLAALLANPNSVTQTDAYKAQFDQGMDAVNRTLAARGLTNSGNEKTALFNYGSGQAQNAYNTQLAQLSGLYGQQLGANAQNYSQLAQLSGLSQANPGAAAIGAGTALGGVGSGYASAGAGLGSLVSGLGGSSGLSNIFGSAGNGISSLFGNGVSQEPGLGAGVASSAYDTPIDVGGSFDLSSLFA